MRSTGHKPRTKKRIGSRIRCDYAEQGQAWDKTVDIKRDELSRWQKFLAEGRVIDRAFGYEEIIDSGPFNFALKNSGSALN